MIAKIEDVRNVVKKLSTEQKEKLLEEFIYELYTTEYLNYDKEEQMFYYDCTGTRIDEV